jgi:HAAS
MRDPEDFLREVADGLPFDAAERAEILDELRAHVADSTAALEAEGRAPDDARRTAVERLGPPERLANALTEARRNRRRLLAAAGAGSRALLTGGFYGWLVGVLLAALAWLATTFVFRFIGPLGLWTAEANSTGRFDTVSFIGIGVAAYVAGSAITPTVAAQAGYPVERVRRILAPVGGILLAAWALAGWSGRLDAVGVVVLLTLPAWWVLGTWRSSRVRRGAMRTFAMLFLVSVAAIVGTQVAQTLLSEESFGVVTGPEQGGDWGLNRIAEPAPAAITAVITGQGNVSVQGDVGVAAWRYIVDVGDVAPLAGWADLRVEAWRATNQGAGSPTPVSPRATGPFAWGSAVWTPPGELADGALTWSSGEPYGPRAMTLSGAVQLNRTPGVTAAWIAITGVAPDGTRHMIAEPDYVSTTFTGTVLDWLAGVTASSGY